jgi:hypothetical protein
MMSPIHQKIFRFNGFHSPILTNMTKKMNQTQTEAQSWQPVVTHKKVRLDPRFILSMERRKVRIISAIR